MLSCWFMGGRQFPKAVSPKPKTVVVQVPVAKELPWYESTLLWGAAGAAIAIVLAVLGIMLKDVRWLLFLAWPFFAIALWAAFKRVPRFNWWFTSVAAGIVGIGLLALYLELPKPEQKPPMQTVATEQPSTQPQPSIPSPAASVQPEPGTSSVPTHHPLAAQHQIDIANQIIHDYIKQHPQATKENVELWTNTILEERKLGFRIAFEDRRKPLTEPELRKQIRDAIADFEDEGDNIARICSEGSTQYDLVRRRLIDWEMRTKKYLIANTERSLAEFFNNPNPQRDLLGRPTRIANDGMYELWLEAESHVYALQGLITHYLPSLDLNISQASVSKPDAPCKGSGVRVSGGMDVTIDGLNASDNPCVGLDVYQVNGLTVKNSRTTYDGQPPRQQQPEGINTQQPSRTTYNANNNSGSIINQGSTVQAPQTIYNGQPPPPQRELSIPVWNQLVNDLSAAEGKLYIIAANNKEPITFANQVASAFSKAGWNIESGTADFLSPAGLHCVIRRSAAAAMKALQKAGIPCETATDENKQFLRNEDVDLTINVQEQN